MGRMSDHAVAGLGNTAHLQAGLTCCNLRPVSFKFRLNQFWSKAHNEIATLGKRVSSVPRHPISQRTPMGSSRRAAVKRKQLAGASATPTSVVVWVVPAVLALVCSIVD